MFRIASDWLTVWKHRFYSKFNDKISVETTINFVLKNFSLEKFVLPGVKQCGNDTKFLSISILVDTLFLMLLVTSTNSVSPFFFSWTCHSYIISFVFCPSQLMHVPSNFKRAVGSSFTWQFLAQLEQNEKSDI